MFHRVRGRWAKARFNRLTREILNTPPMRVVSAPWAFISMVSNSDVQMYLLSMKSFYHRIGRGKIIVIVDRDMPANLRDLLQRHFVGIEFAVLEDIDTGVCQRGGTWERLVYLLQYARREYALQIDCDTLAFGDLTEIIDCLENNRPFTLSNAGQPIRTMRDYAENAQKLTSRYVGIHAESLFDQYPDCDNTHYVRASSGLAGFAMGGFTTEQLEKFHEHMRGRMGDEIWRKWGTEQCGSNFAVANSPNAVILPYPKYANFSPDLQSRNNSFLHFIGTHRYDEDYFAMKGRDVVGGLIAAGRA